MPFSETDDSDMIADEVHKSLLEAATDYNIKCSCHVDPGLHVGVYALIFFKYNYLTCQQAEL